MKILTLLLAISVLISLGFTMIEKKISNREEEQLTEEFKASTSTISPYRQSRKELTTWD